MNDPENKNFVEATAVLEFRSVTLVDEQPWHQIQEMDLAIKPGERVVVESPSGWVKLPLASNAMGMKRPIQGNILFQSVDWMKVTFRERLKLRSQIARIFDRGGWIQSLTLHDNILLSSRHHTRQDERSLFKKMNSLATDFELELKNQRPAFLQPWELKMFQWIRAMMGQPALIIAEFPLEGVPPSRHEVVFRNEEKFRESGGATLWLTSSTRVIKQLKNTGCRSFRISDNRFVPHEGKSQ